METVKEMCGDNRFEVIQRAKEHLIEATNIESSPDEMKVLDSFLFRAWQMEWLRKYDPTLKNATDTNVGDKWVSVEERLPVTESEARSYYEVNSEYPQFIVKIAEGVIATVLEFDGIHWIDGHEFYRVTHWMPLPQPPKEVQ